MILSQQSSDHAALSSVAFLVTGNQNFQETASNMEAFQRIKELLDRLGKPVQPYETEQAAADRSSQEQVS